MSEIEIERHAMSMYWVMRDEYVKIHRWLGPAPSAALLRPLVEIIIEYRGIDSGAIQAAADSAQLYQCKNADVMARNTRDSISAIYSVRGIRGAGATESLYDYSLRHGLADKLVQAYSVGFLPFDGAVSAVDIGAYYADAAESGRDDVVAAIAAAPRTTIIQYHGASGLIRGVVNRKPPVEEKKAIAAIRAAAMGTGLPMSVFGEKLNAHQQYIIAAAFRDPMGRGGTNQTRLCHLFTLIHCYGPTELNMRVHNMIMAGMGPCRNIRCYKCGAARLVWPYAPPRGAKV